ncbi:growth factor receptor-bound protein 10-like protein [Lates japonicus]|uniref:Growth factor receptor-bound protein 10-like protein n=1 Tax=Lates japonicus TaxID=270547 RepID=A0AAD3R7G9_LATJO|nr:growth factor receptor-bound protein 10-like protein [Lates japonicus]
MALAGCPDYFLCHPNYQESMDRTSSRRPEELMVPGFQRSANQNLPHHHDDDVDLEQLVNEMNSSMESVYSTQADTALLLNNRHALQDTTTTNTFTIMCMPPIRETAMPTVVTPRPCPLPHPPGRGCGTVSPYTSKLSGPDKLGTALPSPRWRAGRHPLTSSPIIRDGGTLSGSLSNSIRFSQPCSQSLDKLTPCCVYSTIPWCNLPPIPPSACAQKSRRK